MANKIVYDGIVYQDENLHDVSAFIGDALVSDALTVDTLTATVTDDGTKPILIAANGLLAYAGGFLTDRVAADTTLDKRSKYGAPVYDYRGPGRFIPSGSDNFLAADGRRLNVRQEVFGKFYLDSIKRVGKSKYEINTISAVGLLVSELHYGGMYNGETVAEILADIVGGRVAYTLAPELGAVPVYGWLPIASRRDNLRDLLFAVGGQIRKDALGELNIIPMAEKTPYEINADDVYDGGSVAGHVPATEIRVTEHRYAQLSTDAAETLYEGEAAASSMVTPLGAVVTGMMVEFSEPMYDLAVDNAEILESGVNYAVISASPTVLLTGRKYAHIERVVSRKNDNTSTEPNVLVSKACTLVNLMNSELVAERLMAYYGAAKTVEADIVATTQKPGDAVTFTDPFGEETTGFISSMELTMSAKMKAHATIISGFLPPAAGNYYNHLMVVTESTTVSVPVQRGRTIRFIIIGGGGGGEAGTDGEAGTSGESGVFGNQGEPGKGGASGKGGKGGKPGKVYVGTYTLPMEYSVTFPINIGKGGAGAEPGGTPGEGGVTVMGRWSTKDGYEPTAGYVPLLTDIVYAQMGASGVDGGAGLDGGVTEQTSVTHNEQTWYSGETGKTDTYTTSSGTTLIAGGGGGGGPAVGSNGENGADGKVVVPVSGTISAEGGDAGRGANARASANATIPGSGGPGGHGGGGGGGGGGGSGTYGFGGNGGAGGKGGKGGDGAPGIVLIYY